MNRIRSPLGKRGSLEINPDTVRWEHRPKKTEKQTRYYDVPVLTAAMDLREKAIWTAYFDLLFYHFHLLNRFKRYKQVLMADAGNFYGQLYSNDELDKSVLLRLLVGSPETYAEWSDSICHAAELEAIAKVFSYEGLTSSCHHQLADLIQKLGVNTCPYCGRAFTTTVKRAKEGYIRDNQLDHHYPKSRYPWLALSIRNLIPVCATCNRLKADDDRRILNPYEEAMGDDYRFRTHPDGGLGYLVGARDAEDTFSISLDVMDEATVETDVGRRAATQIEMLGINELYSVHRGHVCEIFRQRYVFGLPYADSLVSSLPDLFHTREDVLAMMSLRRIDAEHIGSMPLDKLTRDIHIEIDELTGEDFVG